jgi:hypothetical protein
MKNLDKDFLFSIQTIIEEHFTLQTEFIESSVLNSYDSLICVLPNNLQFKDRMINFMFIPFEPEDQQQVKLLQFYSIIPFKNVISIDEKIKDILLFLSHRTLIGNFSINDNSEIAYRYILPISINNGLSSSEFKEILKMYMAMLELISYKVDEYRKGAITSDELKISFK